MINSISIPGVTKSKVWFPSLITIVLQIVSDVCAPTVVFAAGDPRRPGCRGIGQRSTSNVPCRLQAESKF